MQLKVYHHHFQLATISSAHRNLHNQQDPQTSNDTTSTHNLQLALNSHPIRKSQ